MEPKDALKLLGVADTSHNKRHAAKFAELISFFEKEKIIKATTEPGECMVGRDRRFEKRKNVRYAWDKEWVTHNEGDKKPSSIFTITTTNGKYKINVPTGNKLHEYVMVLTGLKEPEVVIQASKIFTLPAEALTALKKAIVFVGHDDLRPVLMTVYLEIRKNKLKIVSTDAHRMYYSEPIPIEGPDVEVEYMVFGSDLKKILPKKFSESSFEFEELPGGKVRLFGKQLDLFTGACYVQYKVVIPEYKQSVRFEKQEMINKMKELMPYSNRATGQINFIFNGSIEMETADVDFQFAANNRMRYLSKDLNDFMTSFNGNFLIEGLKHIEGNEIRMMHCGLGSRAALFTNGKETMLLMPLYLKENPDYILPVKHEAVVENKVEPEPIPQPEPVQPHEFKSNEVIVAIRLYQSEYENVAVKITGKVVEIKYYSGRGKTFKEGKEVFEVEKIKEYEQDIRLYAKDQKRLSFSCQV